MADRMPFAEGNLLCFLSFFWKLRKNPCNPVNPVGIELLGLLGLLSYRI